MRLSCFTLLLGLALCPGARADISADLQARSLQYFLDHTNPVTGLVRDRAPNRAPSPSVPSTEMASLAATGFGIAVFANASARGLIPRALGRENILRALQFASSHLEHHRGWLYHFVDWETGRRFGRSEVSTVDTGWFLAGALYASAIFPGGEIERLAQSLFSRLDFTDMMTHGGTVPQKFTLSMGWLPESGYIPYQWDAYSEQLLLLILGLGHPTRPLPIEAWKAWSRNAKPIDSGVMLLGSDQSLFVHQYSHLFVDFRKLRDSGLDYFTNSVLATSRDKRFCGGQLSLTYLAGFWGLSASDSPRGYRAFSPVFHDGTVCPGCAGASAPFLPREVLADLNDWSRGPFGARIWGRYGFSDSFNLDEGWFDSDVIGITVGALYLALADLEPQFRPWSAFQSLPAVRRGLKRVMAYHRNRDQ